MISSHSNFLFFLLLCWSFHIFTIKLKSFILGFCRIKKENINANQSFSTSTFLKIESSFIQSVGIYSGEGNGTPLQYSCLENPWTEESGRLQSMGSLRVGNDWATSLSLFTFMHWRRKWQPTPVFLPGESQGWGSLVGCHLWGRTESDTTEVI